MKRKEFLSRLGLLAAAASLKPSLWFEEEVVYSSGVLTDEEIAAILKEVYSSFYKSIFPDFAPLLSNFRSKQYSIGRSNA